MRNVYGRSPSLPGHRQRRPRSAGISSSQIFSIFALVLTMGFIMLNFWVGVPERKKELSHQTQASSSSSTSNRKVDFRMRRVKLEVKNSDENDAYLSGATNKYFPVREGEILHSWDYPHGLLIDTFDMRTHDPFNPNADKLTVSVNPKNAEQSYFLSAIISTRLSKHSSLHLSTHHIREWIEYMKYAGIEHIYYYDTANTSSEIQEKHLKPYIQNGFISYFHFHQLFPDTLNSTEQFENFESTVHCINNFGQVSQWSISLDLNEYLIMPKDRAPGYLQRYLRQYEIDLPNTSQLLAQCMRFYGLPQADKQYLLTERYFLRQNGTDGVSLNPMYQMTPIFKPSLVENVYKHERTHLGMKYGTTMAIPANVMRKNLYLSSVSVSGKLENLMDDKSIFHIASEVKTMLGEHQDS